MCEDCVHHALSSRRSARATGRRAWAILLCAAATACGGADGPTSPSPTTLTGQWSGTTAHGLPISFTISPDEKVTAISFGYTFNGCSGSHTFAGLNIETRANVICIPGPCSGVLSPFRSFNYSSSPPGGPFTTVNGLFPGINRAEGALGFFEYPGCGTATGVGWTATRR